jgi:hypothetical protein
MRGNKGTACTIVASSNQKDKGNIYKEIRTKVAHSNSETRRQ